MSSTELARDDAMFPWIKDALNLLIACQALRLARDGQGTWRPAAQPDDVKAAFADMARVLGAPSLPCLSEAKRVEETERLRMATQALAKLCLDTGAPKEVVAEILRDILAAPMPEDTQEQPGGWKHVPPWARRRARKRMAATQTQAPSMDRTDEPIVPPMSAMNDLMVDSGIPSVAVR